MPHSAVINCRQPYKTPGQRRGQGKKSKRGAVEKTADDNSRNIRITKPLMLLLLTGLIIFFSVWLIEKGAALFSINHVSIIGEFQNDQAAEIEDALSVHVQGGFFTVDLVSAKAAVMRLAWVKDVSLQRRWPDHLIVSIVEQQAVAYWNDGAKLNDQGEVFENPYSSGPGPLPRLYGPDNRSDEVLQQYQYWARQLRGSEFVIESVSLDRRNSWQLQTTDKVVLILGNKMLESRLQRFIEVYSKVLKGRRERIQSIDLRYSNGFTVSWKTGLQPDIHEG